MMSRSITLAAATIVAFASPLAGSLAAQTTQPTTEPVFVRAQQMITAGHDSAGRAVLDSVLAVSPEGTSRYAEALFWRGRFNKTSAGAERDYRRIVVEYPLSPRAAESLLLLAQLEMTRRDHAGARLHLERLQREHPGSSVSTRGSVMLAQLAFNDGDDVVGCGAVAAAREGLSASDIELRNQLDFHSTRCSNLAARMAVRDTASATAPAAAPPPSSPSVADTASPSTTRPSSTPTRTREFSVQVAAYNTRAEAEAAAKRLTGRGYSARVAPGGRPFRVRIGRYPTRERADAARRQVGGGAVVVEAEPR